MSSTAIGCQTHSNHLGWIKAMIKIKAAVLRTRVGWGEMGSGCRLPPSLCRMCCCKAETLQGQSALPNHSSSYRPFTRTKIVTLNLLQHINCTLKKINGCPLPSLRSQLLEKLIATVAGMLHARLPRRRGCLQETNKPPSILLARQNQS